MLLWARARISVVATTLALALVAQLLDTPDVQAAASVPGADQVYDQTGRLVTAVDGDGGIARYTYDAADNITAITRSTAPAAGIIDVTPRGAAPGTTVTVLGRGFATTASANTVTFNGVAATVSAAAADRLSVVVPATATSGPVRVRPSGGGDFLSPQPFTVPPKAPTVGGFSPNVGVPGTAVTITGTGFQTDPLRNTVGFGSVRGPVGTASATQVGTTVPPGTTSGRITVATPYGSARSSGDFFVPPSPYTATDVDSTGRATIDGPTATVTVPTAGKIGLLIFDAVAGQRAAMDVTGNFGGGGVLTVLRPDGVLVTQTSLNTTTFVDAFTMPVTGTYTVLLDPLDTLTGSVTVALKSVPPDTTGSITAGGAAVTVPITSVGQNGVRTFTATAGQRVVVDISANTITGGSVEIRDAGGTALARIYIGGPTAFIDTTTLTTAGPYSIVVDPTANYTGNVTLQLRTVPADSTGTITVGGPAVTVSITAEGQGAIRTFSGSAGQRITLDISANTIAYASLTLLKPDGTYLASTYVGNPTGYLDATTLPVAGTYSIVVDPSQQGTGQLDLKLSNVPADTTGTMTIGGPAVTVAITAPGQNGTRTFTGTAGQRITVDVTANTVPGAYITLYRPDGGYLTSTYLSSDTAYIDTQSLPTTGTYSIVVDPNQSNTGRLTLKLNNVPADTTGTITVGGAPVTVIVITPGQNGVRTFTGTAGQRITVDVTANTVPGAYITLYRPDGGYLTSVYLSGDNTYVDATSLPVTGTYSILVDPNQRNTGRLTLKLNNVPADTTGTMTIGGPAVTVPITAPGQNGTRTFTGTAGQQITVDVTANTVPGVYVTLYQPGGSYLTSVYLSGATGSISAVTLPATGAYSVLVDPYQRATGRLSLAVHTGPAAAPNAAATERPPTATTERPPPAPVQRPPAATTASAPAGQAPRTESLPTDYRPAVAEDWAPSAADLAHQSTDRPPSPWQAVSPLQAAGGITALSGQVLRLDGLPLVGVTLSVDTATTRTDQAGRFLLERVPTGHHELVIDGATAFTTPGTRYGRFEAGVDVTGGATNRLPYTMWMPKLDTAHEVELAVPTTGETVVTTPAIPGLEVHIPAGSTIRDAAGSVVRRVGITAIPIDRPPFPLPLLGVQVPIYFTVQPGGAYVFPKGAWIVYPNYTHEAPGRRVEFYNYDPEKLGWHVYGYGHVTADGKQVVPDPGVKIYEFAGAMFNAGNLPPDTAPPPGSCSAAGDPVDCASGLFVDTETDLRIGDDLAPLSISRTYRPNDPDARPFGIGSTMPYDLFLWSAQQYQEVDLILPDGGRVHYVRTSPGTSYSDAVFATTSSPTAFYGSTITRNNPRGGWDLRLKDGSSLFFPQYTPVTEIKDRFGNLTSITRNSSRQIVQISTPSGRHAAFTYDNASRVSRIADDAGRAVTYAYDTGGRLASVTDPLGRVTSYTYDSANRMLTRTEPAGNLHVTNTYDANGRVSKQTLADGSTWLFAYTLDGTGKITKTTTTDPRGIKSSDTFDAAGYAVSHTDAEGTAQARTTTYTRTASGEFVTGITDPLGRLTQLTYDAKGNVTGTTRLAGTSGAVTTTVAYDPNTNQITTITDPLGHRWTAAYTATGAPASVTDPLGRKTTVASDAQGRPTSVTDPLGHKTSFAYLLGDLSSATDPLGRTTRRFLDAAGRPVATTDGFGNVASATYDAADQLTAATDALGNTDRFTYDANRDLATLTDPRGGVTRYAYDNRDRVTTRTDALGKIDRYTYDKAGNATGHTDRRGVATTYAYDPLNRLVSAAYGAAITDTYTYDAVDRLTSAASTPAAVAGTLRRTYDGLDRLLTESSSQGTITSAYDKADRRTSMTITGQPAVGYTYDAADQLTRLTRGADTVALTYDAAGRRTATTLPNGVATTATYDAAGQPTALAYTKGTTTLGNLTYGYDAVGQRQRTAGSFATVELPAAVASATYNAGNQLTNWGGAAVTNDAAGNITGDGTHTFTFNARNQLTAIGGATAGTFAYDPLGRRTRRTVGATTDYLFDGQNPVQELAGTTPSATMLTGPGLDEFYGRYESGAASYYLSDALGSTVAMTNGTGLTTRYGYQPYGATTATGPASTNRYQFTGRENDGTGLYAFRARYYNPTFQRFVSEDPLGFGGGSANLYTYAANSPTNLVDPTGLIAMVLPGIGVGLGLGEFGAGALAVLGSPAVLIIAGVAVVGIGGYLLWNAYHSEATSETDADGAGASCPAPPEEKSKRFTPDQGAVIDIAGEAGRKGGVTEEEAEIIKEWGDEYGVRVRGPESHPDREYGKNPHIHVGPKNHIPVK